jgi:hypothetical protein
VCVPCAFLVLQAAVATLARLPNLVALNLEGTPVGDDRFVQLCTLLPNLRRLSLRGARVTDLGIVGLSRLGRLEAADLGLEAVSFRALRDVVLSLPSLAHVALSKRHMDVVRSKLQLEREGAALSDDRIFSLTRAELKVGDAACPLCAPCMTRPTAPVRG